MESGEQCIDGSVGSLDLLADPDCQFSLCGGPKSLRAGPVDTHSSNWRVGRHYLTTLSTQDNIFLCPQPSQRSLVPFSFVTPCHPHLCALLSFVSLSHCWKHFLPLTLVPAPPHSKILTSAVRICSFHFILLLLLLLLLLLFWGGCTGQRTNHQECLRMEIFILWTGELFTCASMSSLCSPNHSLPFCLSFFLW